MKLQRITLKNYQPFQNITLEITPSQNTNSIVILGAQNSGKTSLLKHAYQTLNWFAHRHKDPRSSGITIADQEIYTDAAYASVEIQIQYPAELGYLIPDSNAKPQTEFVCQWRIKKQRPHQNNLSVMQSELQQLDTLVQRYHQQTAKDKLFSTPCIAYYPVERFIYEVNIQGKNTASTLAPLHNAYDLLSVSFTTFNKFFEWFREISDFENAQAAKLFKQYLDPDFRFALQQDFDETFSAIEQAYRLSSLRCISSLRAALRCVLPEVKDISLEYSPKLALVVHFEDRSVPFLQLTQSTRIWIGLVGDLVRRLSLLNPESLYPCLEGEGVIFIDQIDLLLDQQHLQHILPRLQRAFPRLQFIVSSLNPEILEDTTHIQCFQLQDYTLHPLNLSTHQQQLQQIYQDTLSPIVEPKVDADSGQIQNNVDHSALLSHFQTLTLLEQQQLLEQLQTLSQLKEN